MTVKTMRKACRALAWLSLLAVWGVFGALDHEYITDASGIVLATLFAGGFVGLGWLGRLFR